MILAGGEGYGYMIIRKLAAADQCEWLRMRRALWPACSDSMHSLEMKEYDDHPELRAILVVARDNCHLCGFIELSIRDRVDGSSSDRVAYIEGWYVDPDLRDHGVGRQLMKEAERWALTRGLTELASDAEIDNEASIRAHAELGFEETFRLVHFLKAVREGP